MSLTYQQLMEELTGLVKSRSNGTLFIRSDCNHSITVTLESGQITALYFGPRKGSKVIPLTLGISGGSCRFDPNGPSRGRQDLPPTQEIMALLQSRGVDTMTTKPDSQPNPSGDSWSAEMQRRVFDELQVILTDHLGPIAGIIFEESVAELNGSSVTDDSFQLLINQLALNIEAPDEVTRFHDQVANILSGITKG